jgi:hypothetical protein
MDAPKKALIVMSNETTQEVDVIETLYIARWEATVFLHRVVSRGHSQYIYSDYRTGCDITHGGSPERAKENLYNTVAVNSKEKYQQRQALMKEVNHEPKPTS